MANPEKITVEGVEVDTRHWIGGERVASADGATFTTVSPIDESVIGEVSAAGEAEVDAAVAAARKAFPAWSKTSPAERAAVLRKVAEGIEARVEELGTVETRDNGALLRSHLRGVMPRVAMNFRFFADYLENDLAHPDMTVPGRGHRERITYDPAGVVAIITPWNAPLMLATWRIGPALAAGNTVVVKPPEWAPLTASLLADIMRDAGLPDGVFNVVQGTGVDAGAPLTRHPGINRLCFTGSVPTAGVIAAAAAPNIVPLSFELGGKSPLLVLDDADMDLAVDIAVEQFDNAGQVCLKGSRILVDEAIAEEFTKRVVEKSKTLKQGDPRDLETDVSALITRKHFETIDGFVERAKAVGLSPYELLVAASLVEREAPAGEFDKVARVILNRLDEPMRLEFDSTVNYGLEDVELATTDEARGEKTPWNTYAKEGLPDTPIASPSDDAIKAMEEPAEGNWKFFVTVDKEGTTVFSDTYDEHLGRVDDAIRSGVLDSKREGEGAGSGNGDAAAEQPAQ